MKKFAAVISTIVLFFFSCVEVVIAKEMTWNLSGNTMRISEPFSSNTAWNFVGDSTISGQPRISSLAWSRDENGWRRTEAYYCSAQGEQGFEWINSSQRGRLIWEFSDGSTLLLKLNHEISCTVEIPDGRPLNSENNFGSWKLSWDITGGAGKFAGASGRVEGTGDWIRNWKDSHSRSVAYEGKNTAYID